MPCCSFSHGLHWRCKGQVPLLPAGPSLTQPQWVVGCLFIAGWSASPSIPCGLQWHCGNGCTSLHVGKSRSLNSLLCLCWQVWGGAKLFYVFDCSGGVLFKNFLSCCPFPDTSARKRRLSCFFLSVTIGVFELSTSPAPSLGYMRQKENQGIHCCAILWVVKSLTGLGSSLCHSGSSYVCFIYTIQRFFKLYLAGGIGGIVSIPCFPCLSWYLKHLRKQHRIFKMLPFTSYKMRQIRYEEKYSYCGHKASFFLSKSIFSK